MLNKINQIEIHNNQQCEDKEYLDWIAPPKTYGELTLFETLKLIKRKIEFEILTGKNMNSNINNNNSNVTNNTNNNSLNFLDKSEEYNSDNFQECYLKGKKIQKNDFCGKLEKSQFVDTLITQLNSNSDSIKDISILILSYLSSCKYSTNIFK